jgi:hypothetical protein
MPRAQTGKGNSGIAGAAPGDTDSPHCEEQSGREANLGELNKNRAKNYGNADGEEGNGQTTAGSGASGGTWNN